MVGSWSSLQQDDRLPVQAEDPPLEQGDKKLFLLTEKMLYLQKERIFVLLQTNTSVYKRRRPSNKSSSSLCDKEIFYLVEISIDFVSVCSSLYPGMISDDHLFGSLSANQWSKRKTIMTRKGDAFLETRITITPVFIILSITVFLTVLINWTRTTIEIYNICYLLGYHGILLKFDIIFLLI